MNRKGYAVQRNPDPPPLPTDDVRTVWAGTSLWAVAGVVSLLLDEGDAAWTCLAGFLLGLVGVAYMRRRAVAIARDEASQTGPGAAGP